MPRDDSGLTIALAPGASHLVRLVELQRIARCAKGDQREWCACLWHDVQRSPLLLSMGLPMKQYSHTPVMALYPELADFFGLRVQVVDFLFGGARLRDKRALLDLMVSGKLSERAR